MPIKLISLPCSTFRPLCLTLKTYTSLLLCNRIPQGSYFINMPMGHRLAWNCSSILLSILVATSYYICWSTTHLYPLKLFLLRPQSRPTSILIAHASPYRTNGALHNYSNLFLIDRYLILAVVTTNTILFIATNITISIHKMSHISPLCSTLPSFCRRR